MNVVALDSEQNRTGQNNTEHNRTEHMGGFINSMHCDYRKINVLIHSISEFVLARSLHNDHRRARDSPGIVPG